MTSPARRPACTCRWELKFNSGDPRRFRVDETSCPEHDQDATATVRAVLTPEEQQRAVQLIWEQWPKRCACGAEYRPTLWGTLPFRYQRTDSFSTNEARDCACGSTLEIMLAVHNPDEAEVSP